MDNLPFNIVDAVVIGVLVISALLAYARGFVHEVLAVGGWIGAIFAAIYGYPHAQPIAHDLIANPLFADMAAGVSLFLGSLVVLSMLSRIITKRVQDSALNALDRALGFLFGLLRGGVVVCLVYLAVEWLVPVAEQPAWLRAARSMPVIEQGARMLVSLVPQDAAADASGAADKMRKQVGDAYDSQKAVRELITPTPTDGGSGSDDGYGSRARKELDRLFESKSQ